MKVTLTFIVLLVYVLPLAAIEYQITDLGTLGGLNSRANGINTNGQVVGSANLMDNSEHAFLWQNGSMQDLGTLGGPSIAKRINDSGQVVGWSTSSIDGLQHAFLYSGDEMQDLWIFDGQTQKAFDVNNAGQIVGTAQYPSLVPTRAFLWQNGAETDLGTLAGDVFNRNSGTAAINQVGHVTGWSDTDGNGQHPFLYIDGNMIDLGTLVDRPEQFGRALDVNDHSQIVGWSWIDSPLDWNHAFLWENGVMIDLGTLPGDVSSVANAINNWEQVVGEGGSGAFLWANGVMHDLNNLIDSTSNWTLKNATDINDLGQIVGYGRNELGQEHGFLLTPIPTPDLDGDDDVDLADFKIFQVCFGLPADGLCAFTNLDRDRVIDQYDFGWFQNCVGGPVVTYDQNCLDH